MNPTFATFTWFALFFFYNNPKSILYIYFEFVLSKSFFWQNQFIYEIAVIEEDVSVETEIDVDK